ncbi:NfeD family protein [Pseudomonas sp. LRF_L74]|uniref:NfeD family protein n=1 Tax=Pseudomonas sp. LRF_L74 TaxID=3369422 RepID=UPI003F613E72
MSELLPHLSLWHWLILGVALLVLEVFGAAGYALWSGLAASLTGVLGVLMPDLAGAWQIILFSALTLCATLCWHLIQRKRGNASTEPPKLVGQAFVLSSAIVGGHGSIRSGGQTWSVRGQDLPVGTPVQVVAQRENQLYVEALDNEPLAAD